MWYPHVTVATVVERDGRYLVVRECVDGQELINQPAGHLDPDESLVEAAVRETREETGWLVKPTHILGLSQYTAPANSVTYLRTSFIAQPLRSLEDAVLDDGIIEPLWLTLNELQALQDQLRSPMVLQDILLYQQGQRFPLELIQQHG